SLSLQNLQAQNVGDWTFVGVGGGPLTAAVENGPNGALSMLAARPLEDDFRVEVHADFIENFLATYEKGLLKRLADVGNLSDNLPALTRFELVKNFIGQLEGLALVGNFRGKIFLGSLRLAAREGTDLAQIFVPPGDKISLQSVAGPMAADGQIQLLFRCDPKKLCRLLELAVDNFFSYGAQSLGDVSEREVYNFFAEIFSQFSGAVASQRSDDGSIRRIFALRADRERLGSWLDFGCEKLIPALAAQLAPLPSDSEFRIAAEVDRQAFRHRAIPVISVTVRMEGSFPAPGEEGLELTPFSFKNEYFFCPLGDGAVAMTNDTKAMRSILDDFLAGAPSGTSLAQAMAFESDTVARAHLDLSKLVGLEEVGQGFDLVVRFGEGSATIDFSVDGSDLGKVLRTIGEVEK
ncbi:MAG: hypothetical protein LBB14_02325, partial [Puniceicoccales bacterium]|nr:hypothetical protein [Puniceicoccales bacterium]